MLGALLLSNLAVAQAAGPGQMPPMLIESESPLGFKETIETIRLNAKLQGWKVPKKWDVDFRRNMLKQTGKDVGPVTVIKMCEPQAAAKILAQDRYKQLAAMMPCTVAIYVKSDGKTYVSMMNLKVMGQMFGGDVAELAKELEPQMKAMLKFD